MGTVLYCTGVAYILQFSSSSKHSRNYTDLACSCYLSKHTPPPATHLHFSLSPVSGCSRTSTGWYLDNHVTLQAWKPCKLSYNKYLWTYNQFQDCSPFCCLGQLGFLFSVFQSCTSPSPTPQNKLQSVSLWSRASWRCVPKAMPRLILSLSCQSNYTWDMKLLYYVACLKRTFGFVASNNRAFGLHPSPAEVNKEDADIKRTYANVHIW